MVGGGKDIGKTGIYNKSSNRNSDRFKKKSIQQPPTKSSSPSNLTEATKSAIIDDGYIDKLTIKDEDLELLRKSFEENKNKLSKAIRISSPPKTYAVKIAKPDRKKKTDEKTQKFLVARPAPHDARLKPIESAPSGPRYTQNGEIIPHSILGTVQDFVAEAIRRNEMEADSAAATNALQDTGLLEVKKYERPKTEGAVYIPTAFNQENALINWRKRMAQRKKIQGYISDLLEKPLDRLVMSEDINKIRQIREKRTAIERSVHTIDCGTQGTKLSFRFENEIKTNHFNCDSKMLEGRLGSEFWKQTVVIGDPLDGLLTTLTKTEKGMPPEIEHIGKSQVMLNETGESSLADRPTIDFRKQWNDSKFLKKRFRQLKPFMKDIDPCDPDLKYLEVTGTHESNGAKMSLTDTEPRFQSSLYADIEQSLPYEKELRKNPLAKYPDVVSNPMMGPSILFDGIPAYWNGSSKNNKDQVGAVTRVNFECIAGQRTYTNIEVKNNGTTAIFYEWRKIPYVASFEDLTPDKTQRFYFNANEGQILPDDSLLVRFVFKSSIAGIFTETWEFLTTPAVMGGASLCVVLKGVAVLDDTDTVAKRKKIEEELAAKDAQFVVKKLVNDLMNGIRSPERPSSPLDRYKTEKQIFCEKNPKRFYHFDAVGKLKEIYVQTIEPDSAILPEWGLSIVELTSCVLTVPNEEKRNRLLTELNKIVSTLSFPALSPRRNMLYDVAYYHFMQMLDKFVSCSMLVRSSMGLPEVVMTESISVPEIRSSAHSTSHSTHHTQSPTPTGQHHVVQDDKKTKSARKSVGSTKDVKEDKGKKGKTPTKEALKEKEPRPRTATKPKSPHSEDGLKRSPNKNKNIPLPTMAVEDDTHDDVDPDAQRKYIHKFYGHVHSLIRNMIEDMVGGFEAVGKV